MFLSRLYLGIHSLPNSAREVFLQGAAGLIKHPRNRYGTQKVYIANALLKGLS
jgi:hypothetical protein